MSGAASSTDIELPTGWTQGTKEVQVFEWRCPHGDACGKGGKLMYKKVVQADAVYNGAWHLWEKHKDLFESWKNAEAAAPDGITENVNEWTVFFDEEGNERQLPQTSKGKKGGSKGGGGGQRQQPQQHRDRRDRSRSHHRSPCRRSRSRSRGRSGQCQLRTIRSPPRGSVVSAPARSHEVTISRIELDEMIDGLGRAITASTSCAEWVRRWAQQAGQALSDETAALAACKATMERFRRA